MIRNNSNNISVDWSIPRKMDGTLHIMRYAYDAVYRPFLGVFKEWYPLQKRRENCIMREAHDA